MDVQAAVDAVRTHYPRVWHAAHRAHPTDRSDVSPRDVAILVHLVDAELSPTQLADHLGLAAGTVSEALGSLEDRGLVERVRDEQDRRRVSVRLTAAGRGAIAVGSGLDESVLGEALATLSPAERDQVAAGLALLARACTRRTP
jgi:DNA-binding MarR family transcriptional regulator